MFTSSPASAMSHTFIWRISVDNIHWIWFQDIYRYVSRTVEWATFASLVSSKHVAIGDGRSVVLNTPMYRLRTQHPVAFIILGNFICRCSWSWWAPCGCSRRRTPPSLSKIESKKARKTLLRSASLSWVARWSLSMLSPEHFTVFLISIFLPFFNTPLSSLATHVR